MAALRLDSHGPEVGAQVFIATLARVWEKNPKLVSALISFLDNPPHTAAFTVHSQGHCLTYWEHKVTGNERDSD